MIERSREEIKGWLNAILERTGETPSALARRAGLATTTLTRFLNDPDAPMLGLRSISKIAHVTGVPFGGMSVTGEHPHDVALPEAEPLDLTDCDGVMRNAIAALVCTQSKRQPWIVRSDVLELAGVLPGDVLIVDAEATPVSGDIVRVVLKPKHQTVAETVFRLWEPPYLMSATIDRRRAKPLLVDLETVQITGKVLYLLRKP